VTRSRPNNPALVLAALLAVAWLAMFLEGTGDADLAVLRELYSGHRPVLADGARLVTLLGGGYFVTPLVAAVALVLVFRKQPWLAFVLFVGNLAGRLIVEFQKYELGRLRPDENPHLVNVYSMSFPSAHSANAMLTYVALALLLEQNPHKRTWWTVAALSIALAVGFSRVMLGVHWPSDVIAGWSFGLLWTLLLVWIARHPPGWARQTLKRKSRTSPS
jgi:undecaprenyl-diphosphatase